MEVLHVRTGLNTGVARHVSHVVEYTMGKFWDWSL